MLVAVVGDDDRAESPDLLGFLDDFEVSAAAARFACRHIYTSL